MVFKHVVNGELDRADIKAFGGDTILFIDALAQEFRILGSLPKNRLCNLFVFVYQNARRLSDIHAGIAVDEEGRGHHPKTLAVFQIAGTRAVKPILNIVSRNINPKDEP